MERRGFLSRILGVAVAGVVGKDLCFTPPKAVKGLETGPFERGISGFGCVPRECEGDVECISISEEMAEEMNALNRLNQVLVETRVRFAPTPWGK